MNIRSSNVFLGELPLALGSDLEGEMVTFEPKVGKQQRERG